MQAALRLKTRVLPGHRVEFTSPELPEGASVELIVMVAEAPVPGRRSMQEIAESVPPGPQPFATWEEYERFLQRKREAWER